MNKTRENKRTLTTSAIVLLLCIVALIGATAAWFTSTASNTGNRIQAGTLKVDLLMDKTLSTSAAADYVSIAGGTGDIFKEATVAQDSNVTLWEPGKTQIVYLAVDNAGNLALKYNIDIQVTTPDGSKAMVQNNFSALEYAVLDKATYKQVKDSGVTDWAGIKSYTGAQTGDVALGITTAAENGKIAVGGRDYFALAVHMKETAGNEFQNAAAIIDVTVRASQAAVENDGFSTNTYDLAAELPAAATFPPVTGTVTSDQTVKTEGAIKEATVAAGAVNAVFNEMKSTESGASNSLVMTLNVDKQGEKSTTDPTTKDETKTLDVDVTMTALMRSTVSSVTTETTKNVTDFGTQYITFVLNMDTGLAGVEVTHKGNAMVNSTNVADDQGNGIYSYDSTKGTLTIKTTKLSPFVVTYTIPGPEVIVTKDGDAAWGSQKMTLAAFRDSVNAGNTYAGYTATLQKDITLTGVWTPIGLKENDKPFKGTFDGNSKTISGLSITGDFTPSFTSAKAEDYAALFGQLTGGTVKDLTVEGSVSASNAAGVVARFDGGTISNVTSKVTVTASKKAGGITVLAQLGATFNNCSNKGTVTVNANGGERYAAGIVAMVNSPVSIINCTNEGAITNNDNTYGEQHAGGIVALYQSTNTSSSTNRTLYIEGCVNKGAVVVNSTLGTNKAGGIIAKAGKGSTWTGYLALKNCRNEGTISASAYEGDIIGSLADYDRYAEAPNLPRVFVFGTLVVRTGEVISGTYNLTYADWAYVNSTPTSAGGYDTYTGTGKELV